MPSRPYPCLTIQTLPKCVPSDIHLAERYIERLQASLFEPAVWEGKEYLWGPCVHPLHALRRGGVNGSGLEVAIPVPKVSVATSSTGSAGVSVMCWAVAGSPAGGSALEAERAGGRSEGLKSATH